MIFQIDQKVPPKTFKIDENKFGKIMDLSFCSGDKGSYQCFVACNIDKLKKISIFDINLEVPKEINFFYEFDITDQAIVKFSHDYKSFILTDVKEKFLIEIRDSYYCQINLEQLDGK